MDSPPDVSAPEVRVAAHLVRRAALLAPVAVGAAGAVRGWAGAAGALVGLALAAANFAASARLIAWAAPRSPALLQMVVLGGFVARLGLLTAAVLVLAATTAIDVPVLVCTLAGAHLVLLAWETRAVGLSLGAPGLRPRPVTPSEGAQL